MSCNAPKWCWQNDLRPYQCDQNNLNLQVNHFPRKLSHKSIWFWSFSGELPRIRIEEQKKTWIETWIAGNKSINIFTRSFVFQLLLIAFLPWIRYSLMCWTGFRVLRCKYFFFFSFLLFRVFEQCDCPKRKKRLENELKLCESKKKFISVCQ